MGEVRKRGVPVFGSSGPFEEIYPNVEEAIVEFNESDLFDTFTKSGHWYIRGQGPQMSCRSKLCRNGGYEFDSELAKVLRAGLTEGKPFSLECHGNEGRPTNRRCDLKIEGHQSEIQTGFDRLNPVKRCKMECAN